MYKTKTEKAPKKKKLSRDDMIKKLDMGQSFPTPRKIVDAVAIAFPLIFILVFFTKVMFICTCASGSMEPVLHVGDTTFYNRLAYVRHDVERGDIVAFHSDEFGMVFAKRVIGLPGDTVAFGDGHVYINGELADESSYIADEIKTYSWYDFVVSEDCVFVMGDNREDSYDARFWTDPFIPKDKIIGKYMGSIPVSIKKNLIDPIINLFLSYAPVT